jgi:hypothetical protein
MKKLITIVCVVFTVFLLNKENNDFSLFKKNASTTLGYITGPNYERNSKTTTGIEYDFMVADEKYTGIIQVNSRIIDKIPLNQKVLVIYDSTDIKTNIALFDVNLTNYNKLGTILDSVFYHRVESLTLFNSGF